jgi:hypothetical protein
MNCYWNQSPQIQAKIHVLKLNRGLLSKIKYSIREGAGGRGEK